MLNVWALINSDKTLPRHKKSPKPHRFGRCLSYKWRRRRDLNPRTALTAYTLSRGTSYSHLSTSPFKL